MPPPSYSTPPANPEINSTSPFYQTLAGLIMFNRGDALPRGIVHNAMGHATSGYNSYSVGTEGVIIPNSFPFNAPNDGAFANDYSYYVGGMMRTRQWLYEGYQPQGAIPACTIFGIFNFQGASFDTGGITTIPLFGLNISNYSNNGQQPITAPDALCLYI